MDFLPSDLFHLLAKFLKLPELLNLDSAISQRSIRPVFHQSLSFLPLLDEISFPPAGLAWLHTRNISIRQLQTRRFDSIVIRYLSLPGIRSSIQAMVLENGQRMTNRDFVQIGACSSLRRLSLSKYTKINDKNFAIVLKLNPQLEELEISSASSLTKKTMNTITTCCPNLTCLDLSSNAWVDDDAIGILTTAITLDTGTSGLGCPLLKTIVISATRASDVSALNLLDTYPNLYSLEYSHCAITTETALRILRETAIRSIQNPNPEIQLAGVRCLNSAMTECS
jgi:hypothetical protein